MFDNDEKVLKEGVEYLKEKLGEVGTEIFISAILSKQFDYTKWHHSLFENITAEEFDAAAELFEKSNPPKSRIPAAI